MIGVLILLVVVLGLVGVAWWSGRDSSGGGPGDGSGSVPGAGMGAGL